MLLGVTGTIGSGKSYVAARLGLILGAQVLSADLICRGLLDKDQPGYLAFVKQGGRIYLNSNGDIDRPRLRQAAFTDLDIRRVLEEILHPLVRQCLAKARTAQAPDRCVVAEVPLLFESGWQGDFDYIICVAVSRATALSRVAKRDKVNRAEVERIIDIQMDLNEKCRRADRVIDNDGPQSQTDTQIEALGRELKPYCSGTANS
jgi:dephospho-CoA kinase